MSFQNERDGSNTRNGMRQCIWCVHYKKKRHPLKCAAFPKGIPDAILDGSHDHTEPYEGDNGITYEYLQRAELKTNK